MDISAHRVGDQAADRTSTLLALYGELADELAGLDVQSERAGHLRRERADLTEEIKRHARRAPSRPAPVIVHDPPNRA